MSNPWEEIDLGKYEKHMSSDEVHQLQTLNKITKEQLEDNNSEVICILGAAGGNGLENIDLEGIEKVYAIDINKKYLDICKKRYEYLEDKLEVICMDLTDDNAILPKTNLLLCNLIIEYMGEEKFISLIERNKNNIYVVSCVIQKNNSNSFVSESELTSHFDPLLSIHHDIDEYRLRKLFADIGFEWTICTINKLPNNKEFVRIDFKNK